MKNIFKWIWEELLIPLLKGSAVILIFFAAIGYIGLMFYLNLWVGGINLFLIFAIMLGKDL